METKKLLAICGIIIIICLIIAVGTYSITTNNTKNTTIANNTTNINNTTNNTTNIPNSAGTVKDTSSNSKVSDSSSSDSKVSSDSDNNYRYYWNDVDDPNCQPHEGYGPSDGGDNIIRWRVDPKTGMDDYYEGVN